MVKTIRHYRGNIFVWLMALSTVLSCSLPGARTSTGDVLIHGRVVLEDEPVSGLRVGAYLSPDFSRTEPIFSAVTDSGGWYRLPLKPGTYYLAVYSPEKGFFSYSGLNPVEAEAAASMDIGFRVSPVSRAVYRKGDPESAAMEGRITTGEHPLPGGRVFLYLDHADDFRGPGYAFSLPADRDGQFTIDDIPPGSYYVIGRRRMGERRAGPVFGGDFFGYYPGNPVEVRKGMVVGVEVPCIAKKKGLLPHAGATTIKGTIRDEQGRPLEGIYAFAYVEEVVGHTKPVATSTVTRADGTYVLALPQGGLYYVGAREQYGINPQPGERYGLYPETPDHSVLIDSGEVLEGVDMVVEKVLGWEE